MQRKRLARPPAPQACSLATRFGTPLSPADSIAQLERRKREVQGKIDALREQARRNEIPPGNIR
ncbi:MAG: hypothetical protein HY237_13740 [Acidobacteria bacterium]|nr:hypothetical protein [Acidobacteriota bacterium]